jgi:arylsulfatase A-like enzyme
VWVSRERGFGPGFVRFDDGFFSPSDAWMHTLYGRTLARLNRRRGVREAFMPKRSAASVFRAALEWMGQPQERPFLVFLNVIEVHPPFEAPPWRRESPETTSTKITELEAKPRSAPRGKWTVEQIEAQQDAYDGVVAFVDEQIGNFMVELKKRGLEENTIVILTSDHGESLGDHGLQGHTNALYWELVHVPLIVRWPGHLPAGTRIASPVSLASLPATILGFLGEDGQTTFPGPSLSPLCWHGDQASWPTLFAELAMFKFEAGSTTVASPSYYGAMKCLVNSRWHFILHEKFGPQLFDWTSDPQELHDQAKTPAGQNLVREFMKTLQEQGATFAGSVAVKD